MNKAFFLSWNALGDTLCTTPVVRRFRRDHPDTHITYIVQNASYCRVLDGNPDVDLVIYNEHLLFNARDTITPEWLATLPLDPISESPFYHFDMDTVCSREESYREHIAVGFSRLLNLPIDSVRPVVRLTAAERKAATAFVRRPYVVFSRHSNSNPILPDGLGAKDWPHDNWARLAGFVHQQGLDCICIGSESDPQVPLPDCRMLYGLPIKILAALIDRAVCLVTLENGIAHLAAALDAPTVEIYSSLVPLAFAYPSESKHCTVIYNDPRVISVDQVIAALEPRIAANAALIRAGH